MESRFAAVRAGGRLAVAAPDRTEVMTARRAAVKEICRGCTGFPARRPLRAGTATASLPAPAVTASRDRALAGLARRRVDVDRHRHRDRKTKARLGFPSGGPRIPARTAVAQISICQPIAA